VKLAAPDHLLPVWPLPETAWRRCLMPPQRHHLTPRKLSFFTFNCKCGIAIDRITVLQFFLNKKIYVVD
jgi:hypothetical protein